MMIRSSFLVFELSMIFLLMNVFINANNVPASTSVFTEMSQSTDEEQNPAVDFLNRHYTYNDLPSSSKSLPNTGDNNLSEEDSDDDYYMTPFQYKTIWPQLMSKRYAAITIRGGSSNGNGVDTRLWAIPYRFGKRAAMPYRFGKRAGMHFRLGKRSIPS